MSPVCFVTEVLSTLRGSAPIARVKGSRTQIGGPTGAFVVIVAGIVVKFGLGGLALVGIMAGVLLLLMGLTGLGAAVKYIPRPVTIGFTNGIALLIASTQIKDFLGLKTPPVPSEFLARISMLLHFVWTTRWQTVAVAATSLAIILLWPRLTKRIPGSIIALVLSTAVAAGFHLPIETIASKFGGIPQGFPHFVLHNFPAAHIGGFCGVEARFRRQALRSRCLTFPLPSQPGSVGSKLPNETFPVTYQVVPTPTYQSAFRAFMGSTEAARRAGIQAAMRRATT
jgi:hypothetical protein